MSSSNCCFLTHIQISQEAGQVVWYSHLFQNLPKFVVVHIVKGFVTVNKAEVDVFLKLSCFFDYPMDVPNLISGSSAFSKSSLNIWKFMVHVLLKPSLEDFEHYFATMWDECNCVVVWAFFGIAFLRDWNENWHSFSSPVATVEFSKFAGVLSTASSLRIYSEIRQTGYLFFSSCIMGFPGGTSGKESACQCRRCQRCRFDPWVGKIHCRRKWQLSPVFLPGESSWIEEPAGLYSP